MKKVVKGILSPIIFVGGTAEAIVKGAAKIIEVSGETINSTLTNGADRVLQLWEEKNDTNQSPKNDKDDSPNNNNQSPKKDKDDSPIVTSQTETTDPFQKLNNSINKTYRSEKLIDNAEQIRELIRDGSELGLESMVIHCTKKLGAEIKGGLVLPAYTVGVSVSGNNDGTVYIEVKFK
ncbi:MAG: hypothetical protein ACRC2J_08255 [Microcoleaceae cyanobacterium]